MFGLFVKMHNIQIINLVGAGNEWKYYGRKSLFSTISLCWFYYQTKNNNKTAFQKLKIIVWFNIKNYFPIQEPWFCTFLQSVTLLTWYYFFFSFIKCKVWRERLSCIIMRQIVDGCELIHQIESLRRGDV